MTAMDVFLSLNATGDGTASDTEMLGIFNSTYPRETRMPYQGAWPIDLWALEATAFCEGPNLWWGHEALCACGREAGASYKQRYFCARCLGEAVKSR
jgi:hypothetical protein